MPAVTEEFLNSQQAPNGPIDNKTIGSHDSHSPQSCADCATVAGSASESRRYQRIFGVENGVRFVQLSQVDINHKE